MSADLVRSFFHVKTKSVDVQTYHSWLRSISRNSTNKNLVGKSDLMATLSQAYHQKYPQQTFHNFYQVYLMLTEWRSFGIEQGLIDSISEKSQLEYAPEILFLNRVMHELGIVDEQAQLEKIKNEQFEIKSDQAYFFWGYDYFSALQIDFFNSLEKDLDFTFVLPEMVYQNSQKSDWFNWLNVKEIINLDQKRTEKKGAIVLFNESIGLSSLEEEKDIVLLCRQVSATTLMNSSLWNHQFKFPYGMFESELEYLRDFLSENRALQWGQIVFKLDEEIALRSQQQNWLLLKILLLTRSLIQSSFAAYSSEMSTFHSEVLSCLVEMEQKRVYLQCSGPDNVIYNISLARFIPHLEKRRWCYLPQSTTENILATKVSQDKVELEQYLASLGPVKRDQLAIDFTCHTLQNLIESGANFYLPQKIFSESAEWRNLQKQWQVNIDHCNSQISLRQTVPSVQSLLNTPLNITASAMEVYLLCPRQYYWKYLEKINFEIENDQEISANDLGSIAHDYLAELINGNPKSGLEHFVQNYLKKSSKKISVKLEKQILDRVEYLVSQGLKKFKILQEQFTGYQWTAEKTIEVDGVKLKLDLLGEGHQGRVIIDWKTKTIPSAKELEDYQKIQLGYYLILLKSSLGGYCSLSEYDDNIWLSVDGGQLFDLPGQLISYKREEYQLEIESIKNRMRDDQCYTPRVGHWCRYCSYRSICSQSNEGLEGPHAIK